MKKVDTGGRKSNLSVAILMQEGGLYLGSIFYNQKCRKNNCRNHTQMGRGRSYMKAIKLALFVLSCGISLYNILEKA